MKKTNIIYASLFLLMASVAVADNIRGPIIPSLKTFFSIQNTQIGWMLIISSVGYMIGTYFGGTLCGRMGQKRVVVLGILTTIFALLMMAFSTHFSFYLLAVTVGSVGLAFMGIAINTLVPLVSGNKQALIMNMTHFCFGIGAMLTQKISGVLISSSLPWQSVFFFAIGFMVISGLFLSWVQFPNSEAAVEKKVPSKLTAMEKKIAWLYIFTLGFYAASEIQISTWLINYINVAYKRPESYAATFSALYFLCFSVGRLGGGFFVEKRGYLKSVHFAIYGALSVFLLGWLLKQNGLYLIGLSGFFFSISYPTIVLSASVFFKKNAARLTGIVVTGSTAINTSFSYLMGVLNDRVGVYYAMLLIPLTLVFSLVSLYVLRKHVERQERGAASLD